jgi:hypothetical protein
MANEFPCQYITRFTCSQETPTRRNCIACLKQRYNDTADNLIFLHKKDLEKLRKVLTILQKEVP